MFIQTESTPNPEAMKFFPGVSLNTKEPVYFANSSECEHSSLAKKLFQINSVEAVFFGHDFVTITKKPSEDWEVMKPEILMTIMDHFVAGGQAFDSELTQTSEINLDDLSEIEKQIVEIIDTRVRPSVAMDGGDIVYKGFKEGIVYLAMRGACSGCPSSTVTLKNGIESMLQHYVPEVTSVESIEE